MVSFFFSFAQICPSKKTSSQIQADRVLHHITRLKNK